MNVTANNVTTRDPVSIAVVPGGTRPVSFTLASTLAGQVGFNVGTLSPGSYDVYAQVASVPETPVVCVGSIVID